MTRIRHTFNTFYSDSRTDDADVLEAVRCSVVVCVRPLQAALVHGADGRAFLPGRSPVQPDERAAEQDRGQDIRASPRATTAATHARRWGLKRSFHRQVRQRAGGSRSSHPGNSNGGNQSVSQCHRAEMTQNPEVVAYAGMRPGTPPENMTQCRRIWGPHLQIPGSGRYKIH